MSTWSAATRRKFRKTMKLKKAARLRTVELAQMAQRGGPLAGRANFGKPVVAGENVVVHTDREKKARFMVAYGGSPVNDLNTIVAGSEPGQSTPAPLREFGMTLADEIQVMTLAEITAIRRNAVERKRLEEALTALWALLR